MLVFIVVIMIVFFLGVIIMVIVIIVVFVIIVVVIIMVIVVFMIIVVVIIMVIMVIVIIVIIVVFMIIVVMGFKQGALAELQLNRAIGFKQRRQPGIRRQCFDRIRQPWRQVRTNPEYQIGTLQRGGLRRAQAVFVRARTRLHNQIRRPNALHDPRNQRVHRRNINSDPRHVCQSGSTHQCGRERERKKLCRHWSLHVIL